MLIKQRKSSRSKEYSMNRLNKIKEKLVNPALEKPDLADLEKAITIWHYAAESEKAESDIAAAHRLERSESLRFWVPTSAPFITATALIFTLLFQLYQFSENNNVQRKASEDAQWREMLTNASTEGPQSGFALSLIKSFLDSERYKTLAREISVYRLGHTESPDDFQILFPEILKRTDWSNFRDIAKISKSLDFAYHNGPEVVKTRFGEGAKQRSKIAERVAGDFDLNLNTVADALIYFLRDPKNALRPSNGDFDLTGADFSNHDLSNIDFTNATIEHTVFYDCVVSGADFGNVAKYKDNDWKLNDWSLTAWWRARNITPDLLNFLQEHYKFKKTTKYNSDNTKDEKEYQREVDRLANNHT